MPENASRAPNDGLKNVKCSIIIPAYNEEIWLGRSVPAACQALREAGLTGEVIVVDNASTDRTAEVAGAAGARVVQEPIRQISRVRNAGAAAACGEWFFFVDADSLIDAAHLRQAVEGLESGDVCGGGARICFDGPLASGAGRVLKIWNWVSIRFQWAAGSFLFVRADLHRELGGFSTGVYAGEEIFYSRKLKKAGRKRGMRMLIVEEPPVVTSARKARPGSALRVAGVVALFLLFPFAVRSRRLCRFWYEPRYRGVEPSPE